MCLVLTSCSSYDIGENLCAGFAYGETRYHEGKDKPLFCDSRDGKRYVYMVIGEQTWMAENLKFEADSSVCYNNEEKNCETYGRLYNWTTAMDITGSYYNTASYTAYEKHRGICPIGWHIPSNEEWDVLVKHAGYESGTNLKAKEGWKDHATYGNGTDYHGFTALPGGYAVPPDGSFKNIGSDGFWWSTDEFDARNVYSYEMNYNSGMAREGYYSKMRMHSVRCVKSY